MFIVLCIVLLIYRNTVLVNITIGLINVQNYLFYENYLVTTIYTLPRYPNLTKHPTYNMKNYHIQCLFSLIAICKCFAHDSELGPHYELCLLGFHIAELIALNNSCSFC